jgi:hypothetical protein
MGTAQTPEGELCTSGNIVTVVWCLSLVGYLLPATPPDALWGPPSCFTVVECEWWRTLNSVLILRMPGSIPPLHSDTSGIAPSVRSIHYQHFLSHYQHFILTVFSHICWQEMNSDWNSGNIPCDIQINEIHTAVQLYTQVQRKQLHSIFLSPTNIWNIQLFAVTALSVRTYWSLPTSVCERSQLNVGLLCGNCCNAPGHDLIHPLAIVVPRKNFLAPFGYEAGWTVEMIWKER